jgi:hypothetical protein
MHYLFASDSLGRLARLIAQITDAIGGDGKMETYRSVEDFSARLRRHNRPEIMILLAAERPDLERLSANRELIHDADVILLVPDGEEEIVIMAHTLRPNYLGCTDSDLDKIVPVLSRLLQKRARRPEAGQVRET